MGVPELLIIVSVLCVPAVIVILILVTRTSRRSVADPVGILGERLARGEITTAEYDELRRRLV